MSSTRVTVKSEIKVEVKPEVKLEGTSDLQHIDTSTWKTGQKFPTPSPGNGDRVFYESLLQQRPDSEMAQDWCLAYGVLPEERAKKLYNQVCNRKNIKVEKVSTSTISNTASAQKPSARGGRGKARTDLDVEADTGLGDGDVWESNGRKGI